MARTRRTTATQDRPETPLPVEERPAVVEALVRVEAAQAARDSISSSDPDGTEKYARAAEAVQTASLAYHAAVREAEKEVERERLEHALASGLEMLARLEANPGVDSAHLEQPRRDVAQARERLAILTGESVELATLRGEAEERAARVATRATHAAQEATAAQHAPLNSAGQRAPLDPPGPRPPASTLEGDDWFRAHPPAAAVPWMFAPSEEPDLDAWSQVVELLDTLQPKVQRTVTRMGRWAGSGEEMTYEDKVTTPGLGQILRQNSSGASEAERLESARRALKTADSITLPRLRLALHFYPLLRSTLDLEV